MISACLLGERVRYHGGDARNDLAVWGEPHLYSRR